MLAERVNGAVRRVPVWLIYMVGLLPAPWFLYLGLTGGLGVEPIKALEHELGLFALQLLIAGLCVTPLRRFAGVNLIRFRRAIGVLAFTYVALHLLVWLVLDVQTPARIWADIVKRPYITIGMIGFLLMLPLALTSNNLSVRRLGPKWRQLHKLTYIAVLLGAVHFVMLSKGFQIEPLLYLVAIVMLLAMRLPFGMIASRMSRA
ncbi:MAG: protein-methionine-sulfoxide reductase heme-binding subunit MsrQ [Paracoccaceae bacterium]|uniref:protein-methionine-sulfoxide reductase heme-binding subunit MsrQ n=1 Tax=Seohaeicola saemankumensis TaxID=481181 RepID=UPI001E373551|nr:protein-methionine-sulfoxide reductase heme-binding subunit MsrQ [Seohaeicola saemankumensis]MCD1624734.1 protein-methionine-sulfoxide reductase heme-binding subunit MsrQ [Seohaeicola saemankumensis]